MQFLTEEALFQCHLQNESNFKENHVIHSVIVEKITTTIFRKRTFLSPESHFFVSLTMIKGQNNSVFNLKNSRNQGI